MESLCTGWLDESLGGLDTHKHTQSGQSYPCRSIIGPGGNYSLFCLLVFHNLLTQHTAQYTMCVCVCYLCRLHCSWGWMCTLLSSPPGWNKPLFVSRTSSRLPRNSPYLQRKDNNLKDPEMMTRKGAITRRGTVTGGFIQLS